MRAAPLQVACRELRRHVIHVETQLRPCRRARQPLLLLQAGRLSPRRVLRAVDAEPAGVAPTESGVAPAAARAVAEAKGAASRLAERARPPLWAAGVADLRGMREAGEGSCKSLGRETASWVGRLQRAQTALRVAGRGGGYCPVAHPVAHQAAYMARERESGRTGPGRSRVALSLIGGTTAKRAGLWVGGATARGAGLAFFSCSRGEQNGKAPAGSGRLWRERGLPATSS